MRAVLALATTWLACLWSFSLGLSPDGAAAVSASACQMPSPHVEVEEQEQPAAPYTGLPGTSRERSFFAIKPDGLHRGLVSEVISRFERKGWKLVGLKMLTVGRPLAESHYEEHTGKEFFEKLLDYMCSGPVVAMVWEGSNVIAGGRKMLGATNPSDAEKGTIRGDLCTDAGRNLVHASDGPESAEREIGLWFRPEEIVPWIRSTDPWIARNLT